LNCARSIANKHKNNQNARKSPDGKLCKLLGLIGSAWDS
jgi:hypothetical protein